MRGFETYNQFKNNLKDARQLYDITYHLYTLETERLGQALSSGDEVNPTLKTSIGSIEHSPTALYSRLQHLYPFKLRQLILISSITATEVFLTDVINEVFERDIKPFKVSEPITLQRNYLLSMSSMNKVHDDIIEKDIRGLTSGGLKEIEKYYKRIFNIDIKNISVNYSDIEEIHIRRHLFVHRDGMTDSEYISKFPAMGYTLGQQIRIDHDYLINALNKLSEFAGIINRALLAKFPDLNRGVKYHNGSKDFSSDNVNLMIDIEVLKESFDIVSYLTTLTINGHNFSDYIVQIATVDSGCVLFISGRQADLSRFFKTLIKNVNMRLNKTIRLK